jgi:hypothetical protein
VASAHLHSGSVSTIHHASQEHKRYCNRFANANLAGEFENQLERKKLEEQGVLNTHGEAPFVLKAQLNSHAAGGPSWGLGRQNPRLANIFTFGNGPSKK